MADEQQGGSPLLECRAVRVQYRQGRRVIRAVEGVTLDVLPGECVGLVGESGCGKSSLVRALMKLEPLSGGGVRFEGRDVAQLHGRALVEFRRGVQMVFQDPFGSLNPRLTVGSALDEVLRVHTRLSAAARRQRVAELLEMVGLDAVYAGRYPHEFSGGQRQRVGIARALAVGARLLLADEPVSALDVSVQVQILNLLADLRDRQGLACLLIAHDLAVVRYLCRRVHVMYLGRIVESGPAAELYARPAHPYTEALLSAVPDVERALDAGRGGRILLRGDVPSPGKPVPGCPFHPRCHRARPRCQTGRPELDEVGPGRHAACWFALEWLGGAGKKPE